MYDFVRNNPAFWSDSVGLSENSKDDCKCKDLLTADNVKKCLEIQAGLVVGECKWDFDHLIPTCYPRIDAVPNGGGIKREKSATNIEVKGVWKADDHCRKVAECYEKSFANMVTVIMKGIYLDKAGNEYTEYIFNGNLMGLTQRPVAARLGNHNPSSYITGTFNAYCGLSRQIGVTITVTGGNKDFKDHRINFTK